MHGIRDATIPLGNPRYRGRRQRMRQAPRSLSMEWSLADSRQMTIAWRSGGRPLPDDPPTPVCIRMIETRKLVGRSSARRSLPRTVAQRSAIMRSRPNVRRTKNDALCICYSQDVIKMAIDTKVIRASAGWKGTKRKAETGTRWVPKTIVQATSRVLLRSTGTVGPEGNCGVPLLRSFAIPGCYSLKGLRPSDSFCYGR